MNFFTYRAALALTAALVALPADCQLATTSMPTQRTPTNPSSATKVSTLSYTSTFDTYHPFGEAPLVPWQQANEAVYKAGGWRAYAKEAQATSGPAAPVPKAAPAPAPAPESRAPALSAPTAATASGARP